MYCPKCGQEIPADSEKCYSCGEPVNAAQPAGQPAGQTAAAPPGEPIPTNLVWAILTTLFCCLPFGIVAIVYAAQVDGKVTAGDYTGAQQASKSAKTWSFVAFLCGLLVWAFIIVIVVLLMVGAAAAGQELPPPAFNNF